MKFEFNSVAELFDGFSEIAARYGYVLIAQPKPQEGEEPSDKPAEKTAA